MNPFLLLILDGWGHRKDTEHNAISQASTPVWDRWMAQQPFTTLEASGPAVGLPEGQMGNSEVGHLNLGAGRVVWQDYTRIAEAVASDTLGDQKTLSDFMQKCKAADKPLHLMGLTSDGGVHSHVSHLLGLIKCAKAHDLKHVYVHAFLDGRDTPPKSAEPSLAILENYLLAENLGSIVSITGRYWAMDRDARWERTQRAYELLTMGRCEADALSPVAALEQAYAKGQTDEFIEPTAITTADMPTIKMLPDDFVIFANFRSDRARQLTRAFIEPDFDGFERKVKPFTHFLTMTQYDETFDCPVIFEPQHLSNCLGEVLCQNGLRQARIAETEKYAHVTFFFNGGVEAPSKNEERILIPSPKVATYDLDPGMSADAVCEAICKTLEGNSTDVIIANFANADMVGHTGDFKATITAIEALDRCLEKIEASLAKVSGQALVTADHGNAEQMYDDATGQNHTAHTLEKVPLVYLGDKSFTFVADGALTDVVPTLLRLADIEQPEQMTGKCLAKLV